MDNENIIAAINSLPLDMQKEVLDFITSLKSKQITIKKKNRREFGCVKGKIVMHPGFDEPLEDFKDYIQ